VVERPDCELTLLAYGPFAFRHRSAFAAAIGSTRFQVAASPRRCDLVWHPANGTFFPTPVPNVVTVHDAIPFRYPKDEPKARAHEQGPFLRSAQTAARVIAVSRFGKDEIETYLRVPEERIAVIYHGVDAAFRPDGDDATVPPMLRERPYLLFVGDPRAEARKNFATLLAAYRHAWPAGDGPALAVIGAQNGPEPDVFYAGIVRDKGATDGMMPALYRRALAVCVPSYHETFGMPMIEAMACGTPAIVSDASCLPEIAGGAALLVPPTDVEGWANGLLAIAADGALRERLRASGIERASHFSWERSAEEHFALFSSVAKAS
jgi:alpha-1,3-rhamnosyl/mannosyltransferase